MPLLSVRDKNRGPFSSFPLKKQSQGETSVLKTKANSRVCGKQSKFGMGLVIEPCESKGS